MKHNFQILYLKESISTAHLIKVQKLSDYFFLSFVIYELDSRFLLQTTWTCLLIFLSFFLPLTSCCTAIHRCGACRHGTITVSYRVLCY